MEEIRLQKYLAQAGVASRRKAEDMIKAGRVSVDGHIVTEMGYKVDKNSIVEVDGKRVLLEKRKIYIMLHKPEGYVTTVSDQFGRSTVLDLVKNIDERIYPVGRLDYDTSGLLIMTNDGDFTYKITHPSHNIEKTYRALVKGCPDTEKLKRLRSGIKIEDYITSPAKVRVVEMHGKNAVLEITIHEGRNRQVRKMCEAIGHPVIKLKRISIGSLTLDGLEEGKWRYLSKNEIEELMKGTSK